MSTIRGLQTMRSREMAAWSRESFGSESPLRGASRVLVGFRGAADSCRGSSGEREARKIPLSRLRQRVVGPEDLLEDRQRLARERLRLVAPSQIP
jgi:hypothetical protein